MKDKILEKLKSEYASLGLSKEVLSAYAETLAGLGFVTDENIETAIKGQSAALKAFQSQIDSARTEKQKAEQNAINLQKEIEALKEKGGGADPNPNKALTAEQISALMQTELAKFQETQSKTKEAEEAKQARANKILQTAKDLGIAEWRIKEGFVIAENADDETIKTTLATIKQNMTTAGLEQATAFPLSTSKNFIDEDAKAYVESLKK